MKKILILGAGYYYRRILEQLKEHNFHVLATDRDPEAPGRHIADQFQPIDITDRKATLEWAKQEQINAIMPINDFGVRTAAYVASELGLIGLTPAAADAANDKGVMRDTWKRAELPIPDYRICTSLSDVYHSAESIGFPCVLKPTDCGGGGRGVSVLREREDVRWAYDLATPFAINKRLILEEFLSGTEMTVETLSIANQVIVLAMSDQDKANLKTRITTSINFPAKLPETTVVEVEHLVRRAVQAIGISDGMAHTEVIVTPEGPRLVEIGARGGGGHLFHTIIEAVSQVKAPVESARVLSQGNVQLPVILRRGASYRFLTPHKRGKLLQVRHLERTREMSGVLDVAIVKKRGDRVGEMKNGLDRLGYVVTSGATREEAIQNAEAAERQLEVVIED